LTLPERRRSGGISQPGEKEKEVQTIG
jgi:hypothetical protein